jgi:putative ABC transport system permease protein
MRPLASWETFYSINQPVPNSEPPRRRFVQLRTLEDPLVAAEVHGVALYPGGRWMGDNGVETDPDKPEKFAIECVLGEGIAETLGPDYGKKRLVTGDTFQLGEMTWKVIGVMNSEGKTYGSEIWAKRIGLIYKPFGKEKPTTLIMRTEADTKGASRKFAYELNSRYTQHKLKAYSEPDYFAELTKTNNFFLTAIIIVCVVMAIGGVFGMMTTMFATIASRIRDIGVLRLLGFKRWQVTVSFLLESLAVATIGGALGCAFAWLVADGRSSVSMLSAGGNGPGGKSVALTINVDAQVIAMGMLFTLVMGRLGGLVPALSAMRIKILDSLR